MEVFSKDQKKEINKISQSFSKGFKGLFGGINNSGWMIVDPLCAYLQACGYECELMELPVSDNHPQVLMIVFENGQKFIPAGADLKNINSKFKNWMWL